MARTPKAQEDFETARRHQESGRLEAAQTLYFEILARDPLDGESLHQLARTLGARRQLDAAVACFRLALRIMPESIMVKVDLARTLYHLGASTEAAILLSEVVRLQPEMEAARVDLAMSKLPLLCRDQAEVSRARVAYRRALLKLAALPERSRVNHGTVPGGTIPPFFLAYQGRNDRDLQRLWGDYLTGAMKTAYPAWSVAPDVAPAEPGEPIRVGVLSAYFHHHSNWKAPIRGWLSALDRTRFEFYGYHLGTIADADTAEAAALCHRFLTGPKSFADWADTIRADRLHVLLIPGIGMDALTGKLAALRLAPIQATGVGHPETTGLATIDHYLTGALMEPPDADAHYSERLIRLPNLGLYYEPQIIEPAAMTRADIGTDEGDVVYWCCQGLYKYIPRYDWLFPKIAKALPEARFVFIRFPHGEAITTLFRDRLATAFAAEGLVMEQYCRFIPFLDPNQFAAVTRLADVFLDSIGWSGFNSTLEALAADLPVITTPGKLMRCRHAAGILTMLGLPELIAPTPKKLADLAIALGRDAPRRQTLRARIADAKPRLYRDQTAIDGLADYLETAARGLSRSY